MDQHHKTDYVSIRKILAERFPQAIVPPKGGAKKPLKIGIHADLVRECPDIGVYKLRRFLDTYTKGHNYWSATIAGVDRVDLLGQPTELVNISNERYAKNKLKIMAENKAKFAKPPLEILAEKVLPT